MRVNEDYIHAFITRFNIASPGRESDLRNRPGWLARRFEIFEKFTVPSMSSQTDQKFYWIILFDKDTPEEFRRRIEASRQKAPFIPYYTGFFDSRGWAEAVLMSLSARPQWILTTRLDNDDGLSTCHVERLHSAVEGVHPERCAFNFLNGYILNKNRLYFQRHPKNAFFSLLEPMNETMCTANSIKHMELHKHVPIRQIGGRGGWLQVVHGENVSNKIRGWRVPASHADGLFPEHLLESANSPNATTRLLENVFLFPVRSARDGLLSLRHR
ncbi:glycosyltransferase [uncultured Rhodospira sp.]|uniref:glycosyltransferase n=1 Tax=uncultured Rhodospira sp. TaxID=1936189 RepID=UPI002635B658|nr:glycosyltransferase [uncultured Rhodospira sp.]